MFDESEFRGLLAKKGISISKIAGVIGVSTPTLYRKMSGESDFYRKEIQKICDFMREENLDYIFLLDKFRKRNKH